MQNENEIGTAGEGLVVTSNGQYFDVFNPDPATICKDEIANALSKICRYGGRTPNFYSVAEHSLHCCAIVENSDLPAKACLAVLLHDAAEAYVGDLVRPLKMAMPIYIEAEKKIERAIGKFFGIDFEEFRDVITACDHIVLKAEKKEFWPKNQDDWRGLEHVPDVVVDFKCWRPEEVKVWFSRRLESLLERVNSKNPLSELLKVQDETQQLKQALTHVRHYMQAQGPNGVGIREFAAICGVSPTLLSKWTSPPLPGVPDFID